MMKHSKWINIAIENLKLNRVRPAKGKHKNKSAKLFETNSEINVLLINIINCLFFQTSKQPEYHTWSCQNVCDAPTVLLDNIFMQFGTKLCKQVVGIPMGTNCSPPGFGFILVLL